MMRRPQTRRPSPNDSHPPPRRWNWWRRRLACELGGRPRPPLMVRDEAMQVADGKRLLHITLTAALLAQPRANPPKGRRQRQIVVYNLRGFRVVACCDARDEARDVQPGGTASLARPDAVTGVVRKQQLKRGLTCRPHFFRIVR